MRNYDLTAMLAMAIIIAVNEDIIAPSEHEVHPSSNLVRAPKPAVPSRKGRQACFIVQL